MSKAWQQYFDMINEPISQSKRAAVDKAYELGKTVMYEAVEKFLKDQFKRQNNPNSVFKPTIVLDKEVFEILEQIKERA